MFTPPLRQITPSKVSLTSPALRTRTDISLAVAVALLTVHGSTFAAHLWWLTDVSDRVHTTTEGTYIHDGNRAVIWNAGRDSSLTIDANLIDIEANERALYADDFSTVTIVSDSSVLLKAGSENQSENRPVDGRLEASDNLYD